MICACVRDVNVVLGCEVCVRVVRIVCVYLCAASYTRVDKEKRKEDKQFVLFETWDLNNMCFGCLDGV